MNLAIIKGNLGQDPELRHTKAGTPVLDLRVATNGREKVGDEWKDVSEWHTVTVWGKQAEHCAKYLSKGSKVLVRGKIKTDSFEKDGQKHYRTKIVAEPFGVDFVGGRADGATLPQGSTSQVVPAGIASNFSPGDYTVTNEEIPF